MELVRRNGFALMAQEGIGFGAEEVGYLI